MPQKYFQIHGNCILKILTVTTLTYMTLPLAKSTLCYVYFFIWVNIRLVCAVMNSSVFLFIYIYFILCYLFLSCVPHWFHKSYILPLSAVYYAEFQVSHYILASYVSLLCQLLPRKLKSMIIIWTYVCSTVKHLEVGVWRSLI